MTLSAPLLSVVVFVVLNSILFAFYLGKLSMRVDRNLEKITGHEERVSALEDRLQEASTSDAVMKLRVDVLDKLADKIELLRADVAASRAAGETDRATMRRQSEKMEREIGGIHRQLANIATGKTGLLEVVRSGVD